MADNVIAFQCSSVIYPYLTLAFPKLFVHVFNSQDLWDASFGSLRERFSNSQWRGGGGGGGGAGEQLPPSDNFSWALKFKGGAKIQIRNCQCQMLYKICKIQLVNKFKDTSNSGISIAIQLSNSFRE